MRPSRDADERRQQAGLERPDREADRERGGRPVEVSVYRLSEDAAAEDGDDAEEEGRVVPAPVVAMYQP